MTRKFLLFILAFVIVACGIAFSATAEERILDYAVSAKLEDDASLIVKERITVNIEHNAIRRGIYRIFPVKVRERKNLRHYGFEVLSAALDGNPVPYASSREGYVEGVALGDPQSEAPLGRHTYELTYRTTGHVRFLPDHDEIYYNVTGNFWKFPISKASFSLELPHGATLSRTKAYTGSLGESGSHYQMTGPATFETTQPLAQGEGLTIVAAWEKGIIPQPAESLANIMGSHRTVTLFGIAIFQILLFLLIRKLWTFQRSETIIPLFTPPEGVTPGEAACLHQRKYPALLLQADLLWAATNGYLHMDLRQKKTIILTKTDPEQKKRSRPLQEWKTKRLSDISRALFPSKDTTLIDMNKDKAGEGSDTLIQSYLYLQKKYAKKLKGLWNRSRLPGIIATLFGLGLFYLAMDQWVYYPGLDFDPYFSAEMMLCYGGGIYALCFLFAYGFKKCRAVFSGFRRIAGSIISALMVFLLALFIPAFFEWDWIFSLSFGLILLVSAWGITHESVRLSSKGLSRDAKLRGLEMYIRTAEKDRLAKINAPEDTLEKYEEILPYAAALGCADAWQKRFAPLLSHLDYAPDWVTTDTAENIFTLEAYRTVYRAIIQSPEMEKAIGAAAAAYTHETKGYAGKSSGSSSSDYSGFSGGSSGGGSGGGGGGGW